MNLHFFRWKPKADTDAMRNVKTPFVFLHGMGGTGAIWRPIAAQLEDQFDCIAPDQRGHGLSRPVPENEKGKFEAEDYGRDVAQGLTELGITRSILVGHSMGVRTALALAKSDPTKIARLVAVDIGISQNWGGGIGIPLAQFIEKLPESFTDRGSMKDYLMVNCPDPSIASYLHAVSKLNMDGLWVFPFEHQSLVRTIELADRAPIPIWLHQILNAGVKVTFLRGARSQVWLKKDFDEQREKYAHPNLEFQEWENCGHGLPFEQRPKFVEFLKSISG